MNISLNGGILVLSMILLKTTGPVLWFIFKESCIRCSEINKANHKILLERYNRSIDLVQIFEYFPLSRYICSTCWSANFGKSFRHSANSARS